MNRSVAPVTASGTGIPQGATGSEALPSVHTPLEKCQRLLTDPDTPVARLNARIAVIEMVLDGLEHAGGEGVRHEEVRQALRTLLSRGSAQRRKGWESVVEALVEAPPTDAAQLYQAARHAECRRWVLDHVPTIDGDTVAAQLHDRIANDRNRSRTLARLRDTGQLLGINVRREWRYPQAQFDNSGRVHPVLLPVLAEAVGQAYDGWEIIHWLARPTPSEENVDPGQPLESIGPETSLKGLVQRALEDAPESELHSEPGPPPFALLAAGDRAAFDHVARRWLG